MGYGTKVSYPAAIVSALILEAFSTLGFILQRKSHLQNQTLPIEQQKSSLKRPLWHLGFWLYIIFASMSSIIVLSSLPFFVIVPLSSVKLVYNALYSICLLKEKFTVEAVIGTVYIAISSVTIGLCGSMPEPDRTVDELFVLYTRVLFIVYEVVVLLAVIVAVSIIHHIRLTSRRLRGMLFGVGYTIFSSQAALFAKSGITLLNNTLFNNNNQFTSLVTYIVVFLMIVLPIIGVYFLNRSLKLCETVVLIPIAYCIGIIMAVMNTLIYYDFLHVIIWWKWLVIFIASVYLICGVYLLSDSCTETVTL